MGYKKARLIYTTPLPLVNNPSIAGALHHPSAKLSTTNYYIKRKAFQTNGETDILIVHTEGWMDRRTVGQMDRRTVRQIDRRTVGQMDKLSNMYKLVGEIG